MGSLLVSLCCSVDEALLLSCEATEWDSFGFEELDEDEEFGGGALGVGGKCEAAEAAEAFEAGRGTPLEADDGRRCGRWERSTGGPCCWGD